MKPRARLAVLRFLRLLPVLLLSCAPSAGGPADYGLRELYGAVRQVVARHYQLRYDGSVERLRLAVVSVTRFDPRGRLTEEKFFDEQDRLAATATFAHGRDGRLREQRVWDRSGKLLERVEYRYDRQGRLQSEIYRAPDGGQTGFYTYEYDALGRRKRCLTDAGYTLFEYSEAGRRSEERIFREAVGGLACRLVHSYDGGRLASTAEYTYGTQLTTRTFFAQDAAGNRTREAVYWMPETERRFDALTREQDLPRSLLRSVVECEYSYYEK